MPRICIIEDDAALASELEHLLALQGYDVCRIEEFSDAAGQALASDADCILLDLKLPEEDGHQTCRSIRKASNVPIIMLTSSESEFDEVMALGLGADDYVTKPYRPATLLARIQGLLRRGQQTQAPVREYKGVRLDELAATVAYGGKSIELTRNELKMLQLLMENVKEVVSRQQIMYALWESDSFIDDNTLTVNMNRLRKALSSIGVPDDFIKTRRGIGYCIP